MNDIPNNIGERAHQILDEWLISCTRGGKLSRNTIAIGIVVLDWLRSAEVVSPEIVLSKGQEIRNARSGLKAVLEKYGVPETFLKEVTTRQAPHDGRRLFEAYGWGTAFEGLNTADRDFLLIELIDVLVSQAKIWLERKNLSLTLDRNEAPTAWVELILENARGRSGGVIEQHLVGAKLARRFPNMEIPNFPAHAADQQTARGGDFVIRDLVFHVTAAPSSNVIAKCAENIKKGLRPILLVPRDKEANARAFAEDKAIDKLIAIISIEDYLAMNVFELATEENKDFFSVLSDIITIYNQRLIEVETDLSLQIEIT
jgi:hypothetical protein